MARLHLKYPTIFHITILYSIHSVISETCRLPTRLEFVFLVDNSGPYPVQKIKDTVTIAEDLSNKYNGSKFGVSLFSDFECEAWSIKSHCKGKAKYHHRDPNACYTFDEKLTTDVRKIKRRLTADITVKYSNVTDAGINGLFLTGAEPKMGWTRGKNHPGLVRIIVVVTNDGTNVDGPTYGTHNGQPRKALRGDGTDKCETMKNAKASDANRVLGRDKIAVYALVRAQTQFEWNTWRDELRKMKDVKARMQNWDSNKRDILKKLTAFIDELGKDVEKVNCDLCSMLI